MGTRIPPEIPRLRLRNDTFASLRESMTRQEIQVIPNERSEDLGWFHDELPEYRRRSLAFGFGMTRAWASCNGPNQNTYTSVPTSAWLKTFFSMASGRRMQPCDAFFPIDEGSSVPWMRIPSPRSSA